MDAITKNLLATLLLSGAAVGASWAEPRVTYVGLGRYTCSGTAAECAQIQTNNERVEESNRRRYQEGQDKAQSYIEESRRREREAKHDRQKDFQ